MGGAHDLKPFLGCCFSAAEFLAESGVEDFCASAGKGSQARIFEAPQNDLHRVTGNLREIAYLDGRKGLQVEGGETLAALADNVLIVFEGLTGVKAADDVQLGNAQGEGFFGGTEGILDAHEIGFRVVLLTTESAEAAAGDADVGQVDMAVDVEVGEGAAHTQLGFPGEFPELKEIGVLEKIESVFSVEASPGADLLRDDLHI